MADISLATEDGASNNKKSNRVLGLPAIVCMPHDLQRAVLFATGLAGTPSQNPELAAFQKKSSKMVSCFSRSGVANADFFESQAAAGEALHSLAAPNHTRWLGMLKQAERNRQKQPHICVALCGKRNDEESEEEDSDQDMAEDDDNDELSSQGAGSGRSGDEEEVEPSSDDDRVERAVRRGTSYPLQHRLLSKEEFKINAQVYEHVEHAAQAPLIDESTEYACT